MKETSITFSIGTNTVSTKENARSKTEFVVRSVDLQDRSAIETFLTSRNYSFNLWTSPESDEVGYRSGANFVGMTGVILDIDEGLTLAEAQEMFRDYIHIIHTSTSHQAVKDDKAPCDRYRVLLPFDPNQIPRYVTTEEGKRVNDYLKLKFPQADPKPFMLSGQFFPFMGEDPSKFQLHINAKGRWYAVDDSDLEAVSQLVGPKHGPAGTDATLPTRGYTEQIDLADWIRDNQDKLDQFQISQEKEWSLEDGTVGKIWWMQICPWDPTHDNGAAFVGQFPNGAITAGCHHNSCTDFDANGHKKNKWGSLQSLINPPHRFKRTDMGNAERFQHHFGDRVRYCYPTKSWYFYDGTRWKPDGEGMIDRLAAQTVRRIYAEASAASSPQERRDISAWAISSESRPRIKHLIECAKSLLPIQPGDFDQDVWLLNVKNGTLDLRTGILQPHDRNDMITKIVPIEWTSLNEPLPEWDEFLDQVTGGDVDLQKFLQVAAGYTLTGSTAEEKFFFVHGPGASGKSTFMEAIRMVMGDYAKTADFDTFLKRKDTGNARPDIARLVGARLVSAIEADEGKRLAEGLMKSITGGDMITARQLYQEAFEFKPQLKLWLVANHAPDINSSDDGMWRRVLRVPFEYIVPEADRDPQVKKLLTDPDKSGSAILAWVVRGCLEYQQNGLTPPQSVIDATEQYREEMDPFSEFFEEECDFDDGYRVATAELYSRYAEWSKDRHVDPVNKRQLVIALVNRGCNSTRWRDGKIQRRGWQGVRIRQY